LPNAGHKKGRIRGLFHQLTSIDVPKDSTLTSLETGVALADHEHLAATAHNLAVTMPRLGGLQRVKHFHGQLQTLNENSARKCNGLILLSQA
jgi:hypothetical protein